MRCTFRAIIPIPFDRAGTGQVQHFKHIGLYAYTREALDLYHSLPQSSLELSESLDQLRFLQNGVPIYVAETPHDTVGVDTEADLQRVITMFSEINSSAGLMYSLCIVCPGPSVWPFVRVMGHSADPLFSLSRLAASEISAGIEAAAGQPAGQPQAGRQANDLDTLLLGGRNPERTAARSCALAAVPRRAVCLFHDHQDRTGYRAGAVRQIWGRQHVLLPD